MEDINQQTDVLIQVVNSLHINKEAELVSSQTAFNFVLFHI